MMTAPKLLAIFIVALYLQSYCAKVLLVQTHDGTNIAPQENIKSRVPSQIKTSKLKKKTGHHSIQNKALHTIYLGIYLEFYIYKLTQSSTFNL